MKKKQKQKKKDDECADWKAWTLCQMNPDKVKRKRQRIYMLGHRKNESSKQAKKGTTSTSFYFFLLLIIIIRFDLIRI